MICAHFKPIWSPTNQPTPQMFKISPLKTATLTATGLFLGISAASAALVPGVEWTTDGPSSVGSLTMGYAFHVRNIIYYMLIIKTFCTKHGEELLGFFERHFSIRVLQRS